MISILRRNRYKTKTQIYEYKPTNPDTIIIRNTYYPRGLTEDDLYSYYMKNKNVILRQTEDRKVMFFLGLETGDPIVKRKTSTGDFIKLNNSNYKDLITGRTLSIHSTMKQRENFGIVDVDCNDFSKAKKATGEVFDALKIFPEIKNLQIRYTGKDSFHIICHFKYVADIDTLRSMLKLKLNTLFKDKYEVAYHKKIPGKVNLDLSSNKYHGGFITLGSLSVFGLKCMEIPRNRLSSFRKEDAKI
jgi:hypothetical protein